MTRTEVFIQGQVPSCSKTCTIQKQILYTVAPLLRRNKILSIQDTSFIEDDSEMLNDS